MKRHLLNFTMQRYNKNEALAKTFSERPDYYSESSGILNS